MPFCPGSGRTRSLDVLQKQTDTLGQLQLHLDIQCPAHPCLTQETIIPPLAAASASEIVWTGHRVGWVWSDWTVWAY